MTQTQRAADRPVAAVAVLAGLLLALLLVVPGGSSAQTATTFTQDRPTSTSGFGGWLAWSAYDATTGRYHLTTHHAGATATAPIAPRRVPFDVDLGPDAHGHTVAVYSRCRHEPPDTLSPVFYRVGMGCRLYEYRPDTQTQRPLRVPLPRGGSAFLPSIWGNRLAYAVAFPGTSRDIEARFRSRKLPRLYLRTATAQAIRLPGGPKGGYYDSGPEAGPVSLDLRDDRLLYAWWHTAKHVRCGYDGPDPVLPSVNTMLVLAAPRQPAQRLAHGGCPEDPAPGWFTDAEWLTQTTITYALYTSSQPRTFSAVRRDLTTGTQEHADFHHTIYSYSEDGHGASIVVVYDPANDATTISLDPLDFTPR